MKKGQLNIGDVKIFRTMATTTFLDKQQKSLLKKYHTLCAKYGNKTKDLQFVEELTAGELDYMTFVN
jgi:hypothetical protein